MSPKRIDWKLKVKHSLFQRNIHGVWEYMYSFEGENKVLIDSICGRWKYASIDYILSDILCGVRNFKNTNSVL